MDKRRNILCLYLLYLRKKKKRQRRIHWMHPLNLQRDTHGTFVILFEDLKADEEKFFNYFRMSPSTFDELLLRLHDKLLKENTAFRDSISPAQRLAVTIR